MKIIFLSGALGHFHNEMCKGLYAYFGEDFKFIQTEKIDESRRIIGVSFQNLPYVITESDGLSEQSKALIQNCDILIFGYAKYAYIKERIAAKKLVLYYSERLFKKGIYSLFNPRTFFDVLNRFIIPGRHTHTHLICASAYAPYDFTRLRIFRNRMYKWGYYPQTTSLSKDELFCLKKKDGPLELLWVGRLIALKHADDAILVLEKLKKEGLDVHLTIIGTGTDEKKLQEFVRTHGLSNDVSLLGAVSVNQTRKHMEKADVFMFTSDFREGWGATLNEAMNSACAVVASHAAGSTPFLVKHEQNGLVYKSGDVESMYIFVKKLVTDPILRHRLGSHAYDSISEQWNIENACNRLVMLLNDLHETGKSDRYNSGPCSKAEVIKPNWINHLKHYE